MNKKAFVLPLAIAMALFIIIALVVVSTSRADTVSPLDPVKDGCKPTPIGIRVSGTLEVGDRAWFGVIPEIQQLEVDDVKTYNALLGMFEQDFDWKVELIDPNTKKVIAKDKGASTHPGGDEILNPSYLLDFKLSDNNCNGILDEDYDVKLVATVSSEEGENSRFAYIQFRSGEVKITEDQAS